MDKTIQKFALILGCIIGGAAILTFVLNSVLIDNGYKDMRNQYDFHHEIFSNNNWKFDSDCKYKYQKFVKVFDKRTNQGIAQQITDVMISNYEMRNEIPLDPNLYKFYINDDIYRYGFVIELDSGIIVAHANPEKVGLASTSLSHAVEPYEQLVKTLKTTNQTFVHYDFENPDTGEIEAKTSWFKQVDGYVFASGFYQN